MKKLIYGSLTLALLTSASPSFAVYGVRADQPWSGFYAGANVGYAWNRQAVDETGSTLLGTSSIQTAINRGAIPATLASDPSGAVGGFEANYNYGINRWFLAGIAADYGWANVYANETVNTNVPPYVQFATSAEQNLQSFSTVRLLLGVTPSTNYPVLAYLTGGLAIGKKKITGSIVSPGCTNYCGSKNTSDISTGWVLGAGLGYAITPDWAVKAEYLYYSLGDQSQQVLDQNFPGHFLAQSVTYNGNITRFSLDYKFV